MSIWKQTTKELVVTSFIFKLFKVGFQSEKSQKEGKFDVLESKDWVNVVALTEDKQVFMVRQFRFGSKELSLEFPAGAIEVNETPLQAAKRELLEETGGEGTSIFQAGRCKPNPAFLNNTCFHFVAKGVQVTKTQELDHFEEVEVELLPLESIDQKIQSGEISHSLSIAAWHFFKSTL